MKTDHSITKGYPWDTIISKERFGVRPNIIIDLKDARKTKFWVNKNEYPEYRAASWLQRKIAGRLIDFLEFRIFDYTEALHVAETQIAHMQEEQPFLAEDFGFVKTVGPTEISDNPLKIYTSKYDDRLSIFRNDDEEHEWHLLRRVADGSFGDTTLQLPNHRIAYAAFLALGVKVEDDESQEKEIMRDKQEKLIDFVATYAENTICLKAFDEDDARSRAKFIFETGDFGIADCDFEKILITNK